jgi:hypothetical protein
MAAIAPRPGVGEETLKTHYAARNFSGLTCSLLCCVLALTVPNGGFAQNSSKALSEDDILRALRRGVLSSVIESSVRKTGIGFVIDEKVEAELRKAGASEGLILEIKELAQAPVSPPRQLPAPPPVQEPSPQPESQPLGSAAAENVVPSTGTHSASHSISETQPSSQPSVGKTPVLVMCDADCKLRIDGGPAGSLKEKEPKLLKLVQGDHLIEASALAGNVTWSKTLTLAGADQIIINTELRPLLLAEKTKWLIRTWTQEEHGHRHSDETCDSYYDTSNHIRIYVTGANIIGDVDYAGTATFPNCQYEDVCTREREVYRSYHVHYSFVVAEVSDQSAKVKLLGDVSCDAFNCQMVEEHLHQEELTLTLAPERGLDVQLGDNRVNGWYR